MRTCIQHTLSALIVAAGILLVAAPAHATTACHQIDKIDKTATGAKVHVLMMPDWGYERFSVGVAAAHYRGKRRLHAKTGDAKRATEVVLDIPYTSFKPGQQVRVISSWPLPYSKHTWGFDQASVFTMP